MWPLPHYQGGCRRVPEIIQAAALIFYEQPQSLTPQKDPHPIFRDHRGADPSKNFSLLFPEHFFFFSGEAPRGRIMSRAGRSTTY